MAHISGALYQMLSTSLPLIDLVNGRVRRLFIHEEETAPFIQMRLAGLQNEATLGSGPRNQHASLVEISSWGDDYDTAREVAETVRSVLSGQQNFEIGGVYIGHIEQTDEEEQAVDLTPDRSMVRIVQMYEVFYRS